MKKLRFYIWKIANNRHIQNKHNKLIDDILLLYIIKVLNNKSRI